MDLNAALALLRDQLHATPSPRAFQRVMALIVRAWRIAPAATADHLIPYAQAHLGAWRDALPLDDLDTLDRPGGRACFKDPMGLRKTQVLDLFSSPSPDADGLAPWAVLLRGLDLSDWQELPARAATALGCAPELAQLETLVLDCFGRFDECLEPILEGSKLERLRRLSIERCNLYARDFERIWSAPAAAHLEALSLLSNPAMSIGDADMSAGAPGALKYLALTAQGLSADGLGLVLAAPRCANLRHLTVCGNRRPYNPPPGDALAETIAEAKLPLRTLRLSGSALSDAGLRRLLRRLPADLVALDLSHNALTGEAVLHVLDALERFTHLESLIGLHTNPDLSDDHMRLLEATLRERDRRVRVSHGR